MGDWKTRRLRGKLGGWKVGWEAGKLVGNFDKVTPQLKFCSQSSYFTFSTGASCSEMEILLAAAMEIQWMSLGEMHRIGLKTENLANSL